jgi:hypothetical protein
VQDSLTVEMCVHLNGKTVLHQQISAFGSILLTSGSVLQGGWAETRRQFNDVESMLPSQILCSRLRVLELGMHVPKVLLLTSGSVLQGGWAEHLLTHPDPGTVFDRYLKKCKDLELGMHVPKVLAFFQVAVKHCTRIGVCE